MSEEGLPPSIKLFIEKYIFSVEQLEILLFLASRPNSVHTVQSVYDKILSAKPSIEMWLARFVDLRIVAMTKGASDTFKFSPADPGHATCIRELAESYRAMPVRVIEAIYNRQRTGGRSVDPAQGFADAFKLRKQ